MNRIQDFFSALPDAELRVLVQELKQLSDTGTLPADSVTLALASRLAQHTGVSQSTAVTLMQLEPLRQAAFRWAQVI